MLYDYIYVSCNKFTCRVDLDNKGMIVGSCPFLRKFTGQHFDNLEKWMNNRFRNIIIKKLNSESEEGMILS